MPLEALVQRADHLEFGFEQGRQQLIQPLDGLLLLRQERPSPLESMLYEPVMCLILRGAKQVSIGDQTVTFGRGECLLVSHDMPVSSRIIEAPYLALVLQIDLALIRELQEEVDTSALDEDRARTAETYTADPELVDALDRYLALVDTPMDAKILGPLIMKELHFRLLVAPFGCMLRCLVRSDSNASAISRAIGHIRGNIRSTIAVPDLARLVGMSVSSFHEHFKRVTATTPLQYQKELRLLEARTLLRTRGTSVTTTAFDVGYESPSQFSREYARKFGVPPSQDMV